ncbi:SpoIIE family protein phosphatase [Actinocorallia sp. A-T 12471]|uniref:SpoIIE family protein phosphatase n=1 Tax=Actinocorallia sp. A-T 12471 TaxID=3089813 RepID=UPI0029D2D7A8|nr:SpoIIE family protein phosphatase [Actinocorallia sp. A-T 12471]MDX6745060.1 SpoIIE family protein phosphatase [Actinocorallia sp. A-T 12471]
MPPEHASVSLGAPRGEAAPDLLEPMGTVHVLLVEDDRGDKFLVEGLLEECGMATRLTWARSMAEAHEHLTGQDEPDCVLLDLHLGDAQGLSAVTRLLAVAPDAAVVVLTGLSEARAGLAAVAAGAQDYLAKGQVDPEGLGRIIRYAVQRRQVQQAAAQLQAERIRAEENARLERGLLPRPLVTDELLEVVSRYRPGRDYSLLGGDFFDVVEAEDGVHAVIGDVSGHGPAEAALGVCLRVAWRSFVLSGVRGTRLLGLMEELLDAEREEPETFVTATIITLPTGKSTARVARAGHHGLLMHKPGTVEWYEPEGGLALGMVPGLDTWTEHTVPLDTGTGIVLFTDGLFEGRTSDDGHRLDISGLLDLAGTEAHRESAGFVDAMIAGAEEASAPYGGLADDVAVLYVRRTA